MIQLSTLVKRIKKRKGEYSLVAKEIGITYSQLYRVVSGRTTVPKLDVWYALQRWWERDCKIKKVTR